MTTSRKIFIVAAICVLAGLVSWIYYQGWLGPHIRLTKKSYRQLKNWQEDDHLQALLAFQYSCQEIQQRKPSQAFSKLFLQAGTVEDWQRICQAASTLKHADKNVARQFFEEWFEPYLVTDHFNAHGRFTGYYLPLLHGSLKKQKTYSVPVYAMPTDLVKVNLEVFHPALAGKKIIGRIQHNTLVPYPDRAAINQGAINNHAKVLVWVNSATDLFFAQIQGSALVRLQNGQTKIIGYMSANGHAYTPIGAVLIRQFGLDRKNMSMQRIRAWLEEHPDQADTLLNQNASYVFFRLLNSSAPLGTEQVPLTAKRSLAVDTKIIPIGVPLWLDTAVPDQRNTTQTYRHLMVAQDTGGAIKGAIRGDIYFGAGIDAEYSAGYMNHEGRYWLLLPRRIKEK